MEEMNIKISVILKQIQSLKSAKVEDDHDKNPKSKEAESEKEIKQDKIIEEMKLETIDKDESIRIMKDSCKCLEDKLTKQAQEYDTLAEVAGKMFSELKLYRDSTSNENKTIYQAKEEKSATTSQATTSKEQI